MPARVYVTSAAQKMDYEDEKVDLIVQPGDGIAPLIAGIKGARQSIQIVIFRFDAGQIEQALTDAARRGVFVHAMVAHTNDEGGGTLRKLELRLLEQGITVARTASDLLRYHDKLMIVDERTLYLLGFNYTYEDIQRSRSVGIVTCYEPWVREAISLFKADSTRQTYTPDVETFLVSPINARQGLSAFIAGARRQLLIYDKRIMDPGMLALLFGQAKAGLDIRIIGKATKQQAGLNVAELNNLRLHMRGILRDGEQAFIGSQSLRDVELDARREVGVILHDPAAVTRLTALFEEDWAQATGGKQPGGTSSATDVIPDDASVLIAAPGERAARDDIPASNGAVESPAILPQAIKEVVKEAVREVIAGDAAGVLPLKEIVKEAVRELAAEETLRK